MFQAFCILIIMIVVHFVLSPINRLAVKDTVRTCQGYTLSLNIFRAYEKVAPPHSFIHELDFPTTKDLADHLVYLAHNETAYSEYFWWTDHYDVQVFNHFEARTEEIVADLPQRLNPFCKLCKMLNEERPRETIKRAKGVWSKKSQCW